MINTVIDNLLSKIYSFTNNKEYKKSITSLKESSKGNNTYMTESYIEVCNGDILKDLYASKTHFPKKLKSVDAIFQFENSKIYLIEFKNGKLDEKWNDNLIDIHKKAYDTLIILLEMKIINNMTESNKNISFILVYNDSNCYNDSRDGIYEYIKSKTTNHKNKTLFKIDLLKGSIFHDSFAIDIEDFKSKILPELESENNLTTSSNLE